MAGPIILRMRPALLTLLLLLAACEKKNPGGPATEPPRPDASAASPATGLPRLREMYDNYRKDLESIEERVKEGKPVNPQERANLLAGIGHLQTAARLAVEQEAVQVVRDAHASLVAQQTELLRQDNTLGVEELELTKILDGVERGTEKVPPGHTAAEIEDKRAQIRERRRALVDQLGKLREEMGQKERILEGVEKRGEKIPPAAETLLTRQLAACETLLKRAQALP